MRLGSNMRIFRVTDYNMYIWLEPWRSPVPLLFELGETMKQVDPHLTITNFDAKPFVWNLTHVNEIFSELVKTFLEVRGNKKDLDSFEIVFDTDIGVDMVAVIRLLPDMTIQMSVADIRFNWEHTNDTGAPLAFDRLLSLFCKLVATAQPEHAEVTTYPPITETWYEDIRVSVDLTKVPITIQWLNFFNAEWIERLGGEKKFRNVPVGEVIDMPSGIVFVIQHDPFTYGNPEHVERQKELHKYFGLVELHKKYPRPR
jgi:hypothetical protein